MCSVYLMPLHSPPLPVLLHYPIVILPSLSLNILYHCNSTPPSFLSPSPSSLLSPPTFPSPLLLSPSLPLPLLSPPPPSALHPRCLHPLSHHPQKRCPWLLSGSSQKQIQELSIDSTTRECRHHHCTHTTVQRSQYFIIGFTVSYMYM